MAFPMSTIAELIWEMLAFTDTRKEKRQIILDSGYLRCEAI